MLLFRLGNVCGENAFMLSSGTWCKANLGRSIVPLEQAQSRVWVRSGILSGIGWLRARPLRRTNLGFILMEINRVGQKTEPRDSQKKTLVVVYIARHLQ